MYIDSRMGIYFLDSDGRGLSVMDLMDPPKAEWQNQYIWDFFVGKFNKEHPEFRIGIHDSTVNLDYKYPEVRQLKLQLFKEALDFGLIGLIAESKNHLYRLGARLRNPSQCVSAMISRQRTKLA